MRDLQDHAERIFRENLAAQAALTEARRLNQPQSPEDAHHEEFVRHRGTSRRVTIALFATGGLVALWIANAAFGFWS